MNIIDRVINNPKSTLEGLFTGMLQSAFLSAANAFLQTGNTTDGRAYAVAGGVGAVTALVGALKKDKQPAPTAVSLVPVSTVDPVVAEAINQATAQLIANKLGKPTE